MLRPAMIEMLKPDQDCYSFVVAVAKRARELADEAEEKHEIIDEKPVRLAIDEFAGGETSFDREHHAS